MKRVYGGNFIYGGGQKRGIFCGTQKEIAEATKCSLYYIRGYWCVTGNETEIEVATSKPKTLFWCDLNAPYSSRIYFEVIKR